MLLLPPVLFVVCLYPLTEKVIFNGKDYQQADFTIDNLFKKEPSIFINLLRDIFSAPLSLDWYKVSIVNRSTQESSDCVFTEPSIIRISFYEGDPRRYGITDFKEEILETNNGYYKSKYPDYHLRSGDSAFFIAPSWEKYSINGGLLFSGDCKHKIDTPYDYEGLKLTYDYDISIKPYLPSWFVRLLVICTLWVLLFSSILSIRHWLKG